MSSIPLSREERLAAAEQRTRAGIAAQQTRLAQIQAQQRAEARKALTQRRAQVGKLADKAGLLAWDDATLDHLFTLLAMLRELPDPIAVLDALLHDKELLVGDRPC